MVCGNGGRGGAEPTPVVMTASAPVLVFIPPTHSVSWASIVFRLIGGTAVIGRLTHQILRWPIPSLAASSSLQLSRDCIDARAMELT